MDKEGGQTRKGGRQAVWMVASFTVRWQWGAVSVCGHLLSAGTCGGVVASVGARVVGELVFMSGRHPWAMGARCLQARWRWPEWNSWCLRAQSRCSRCVMMIPMMLPILQTCIYSKSPCQTQPNNMMGGMECQGSTLQHMGGRSRQWGVVGSVSAHVCGWASSMGGLCLVRRLWKQVVSMGSCCPWVVVLHGWGMVVVPWWKVAVDVACSDECAMSAG
jgi:hypothetical protein